jgi:hypothetical protein
MRARGAYVRLRRVLQAIVLRPGHLGWGVGGFAVWTAFFVARVHAAEDGAGGIVTV